MGVSAAREVRSRGSMLGLIGGSEIQGNIAIVNGITNWCGTGRGGAATLLELRQRVRSRNRASRS